MPHENTSDETKLAWASQYCHDRGLRKTQARDALLKLLVESEAPVNWRTLSETPVLKELCDPSTVYRLLVKLEQIGLVRRITVREQPPFFTIGVPGEHNDYVVCTECSSIRSLHFECPGSRLSKQIEERLGFRGLHHEFAFYGICRECQQASSKAAV
ncbi:MAG: transcriptional repressor [Verrucomicrobiota bacterium]